MHHGRLPGFLLFRQTHLLLGLVGLVVTVRVHHEPDPGQFASWLCQGQPIAHTMSLWNFGGMVLSGLAFALAGGCPGRQLFPGR